MNRIIFLLACVLLIVGASGKHYIVRGPTSTAEVTFCKSTRSKR